MAMVCAEGQQELERRARRDSEIREVDDVIHL